MAVDKILYPSHDLKYPVEARSYTDDMVVKEKFFTKDEVVTMLTELLAELKELPKARFYETNEFGGITGCIDYPAISKNALDLIQQKINELEEQRDETDKSNK